MFVFFEKYDIIYEIVIHIIKNELMEELYGL